MSQPIRSRPISMEDYLQLEEMSEMRHEYVAGRIYALAGATPRHNRIAGNLFRRLATAAAGGPCRVYISDVKLRVGDEASYYPDVMVACGPEREDELKLVTEPCLLIEVTSPSTEVIDRREKLAAYKRLATLRAYVIVDQDRRHVERHARDDEGTWWDADVVGEGRVPLPCPELTLTLDEIYEGVDVA